MIPIVESAISISGVGVDPIVDGPLHRESVAPKAEVGISIAVVDELKVPIANFLVQPTQLSLLFAISQGSYRSRWFFSPLCI